MRGGHACRKSFLGKAVVGGPGRPGAALLIALKTVPGAPPEPLYFVPGNPGKVAFTFEALWGTEGLEEILAVLKREGVHCTFL